MSPSQKSLSALLAIIAPGNKAVSINRFEASYSNHTHLVEIESADGTRSKIVIRCYAQHGDPSQKALREFKILELLQDYSGIPAPEPLYLDAKGRNPGIAGHRHQLCPWRTDRSPARIVALDASVYQSSANTGTNYTRFQLNSRNKIT